jgi:tyrosinase
MAAPVAGVTPTVKTPDLASPSQPFAAMVPADGFDWAVAPYDGTTGGLYAIGADGTATSVAPPAGATPGPFPGPVDMTVGPDGALYVSDPAQPGGGVFRCTITATPSADCVLHQLDSTEPAIRAEAIASAGSSLWVTDTEDGVWSMSPDGTPTGLYGYGNSGGMPFAHSLVSAGGFLWVIVGPYGSTSGGSQILKVDPATGGVDGSYTVFNAIAVTADDTGTIWYVGQSTDGYGVGEINPTSGATAFYPLANGTFSPYQPGIETIAPGPAGSGMLFFNGQNQAGAPVVGRVVESPPTGGGCQVRQDVRSLSADQLARFEAAFHTLASGPAPTPLDRLVDLHIQMSPQIHDYADFLPWHRWFLTQLQSLLSSVDPTVVLPYWNVSLDSQNLAASPVIAEFGGNGNPANGWIVPDDGSSLATAGSRFYPSAHGLVRDLTSGQIASPEIVNEGVVTATSFTSLATFLGGAIHGEGHSGIGGTLDGAPVGDMAGFDSPNDPLFWMFHAYLDDLWSQWQAESPANATAYGGINLDGTSASVNDVLPGSGTFGTTQATVQSVMSINSLCYSYQSVGGTTPAAGGPPRSGPASGAAAYFERGADALTGGAGVPTSMSVVSSAAVIRPGDSVTLTASSQSTQGAGSVAFAVDGVTVAACPSVPLAWTGHTWQAACKLEGLPAGRAPHAITATLASVGEFQSTSATLAGGILVSPTAPRVQFRTPVMTYYGHPIGSAALSATSAAAGRMTYTAAPVTDAGDARPVDAHTVLHANEYYLQAHFAPADGSTRQIVTVPYVVDPAPLRISPDNLYMARGQPKPELTWTAAGFVNGDTPASLLQSPYCTLAAGRLTVGRLKIWCDGGYSPDYAITYPRTATLMVRRHPCALFSPCATDPPPPPWLRRADRKALLLLCHLPVPRGRVTFVRSVRSGRRGVRKTTWIGDA